MTYPITCAGGVSATYTLAYAAGTLTIAEKPTLTVTLADDKSRTTGAADPLLNTSSTGLLGNDTAQTAFTIQPTRTTTAVQNSPAGPGIRSPAPAVPPTITPSPMSVAR